MAAAAGGVMYGIGAAASAAAAAALIMAHTKCLLGG